MQIVKININDLKPYEKNAKLHPRKQIEQIKNSIEQFGMNDPIGVWGDENIIVEGHGRLEAVKELGFSEVECIRLDHLTDEERKAYTLAHNQINMNSGFDFDILGGELDDILNIDMEDFGFDFDNFHEDVKVNERHRTNDTYNLDLIDSERLTNDFWQIPIIENDNYIPDDLIGFNYAKTSENKKCGIHFYLDDYQFERIWNSPDEYTEILAEYECILSPDFSLYLDMPMPMKIWNIYRSRQIGQYYQSLGIKVIPTISWAEKETFEFAFKGIPKGSIVSISTIGVKRDTEAMKIWADGMDAMINEIQPKTILVYGGKLDYDYGDIEVIYYENKVTEKMKELGDNSET